VPTSSVQKLNHQLKSSSFTPTPLLPLPLLILLFIASESQQSFKLDCTGGRKTHPDFFGYFFQCRRIAHTKS
jgi:hypothetical protein